MTLARDVFGRFTSPDSKNKLLSLESNGLNEAIETMAELHKQFANYIESVELIARKRHDATDLRGKVHKATDFGNAEILADLKKDGRDFIALSREESRSIGRAFAEEFERLVGYRMTKAVIRASVKSAWIEAIQTYRAIVASHISQGESSAGSIAELTREYARRKLDDWGFTHPIGKASGQLHESLNDNSQSQIRVKTKGAI
jgi:hypothetical protein